MKHLFLTFFVSLLSLCAQAIDLPFAGGVLRLTAQSDNAVRIMLLPSSGEVTSVVPEQVFVETGVVPKFSVKTHGQTTVLKLPQMRLVVDGAAGRISAFDKKGREFFRSKELRSKEGATLTWESPSDEMLYGLGQFQDGHLNIRGLQRRLTQVNTQISVPVLLSTRGYGLLWHNYGLTEWNPAPYQIKLNRQEIAGEASVVNVTGTSGNRQERREEYVFESTIDVSADGDYSLLLDVGQSMARRHHLVIDDVEVVNMRNIWLPPTTSVIVHLSAGRHHLKAHLEKNDRPTVSIGPVRAESTLHSPVADAVDFTLFVGSADEVIASLRGLTGGSPMLPRWALGYIHCRERFSSQEQLLSTARRLREERFPSDVIVQDWQYWGRYGWNAMRFDERDYPDVKSMTKQLHEMDMRLMLSVWSRVDLSSEVGQLLEKDHHFISGTQWVDFFNPSSAAAYWEQFSKRLVPLGIDAWWQDATEPENDDLVHRRVASGTIAGEEVRNIYPLQVCRTVYEGLRASRPNLRPMILTRSAFAGQQRYAAATWSGDVGHDWQALSTQITAGLGMMSTGQPWWTYDAGGFFRPFNQYESADYQQCMLRWLQTAVYLPLMRVHGYQSNTEPWNYKAQPFAHPQSLPEGGVGPRTEVRGTGYEVEDMESTTTDEFFRQALTRRYQLLPYLYSAASAVTLNGKTLTRPLVMDYPETRHAGLQFLCGPSLMVVPVTESMNAQTTVEVVVPQVEGGWWDFWSGQRVEDQSFRATIASDHIPVFVRAGSILPLAEGEPQHTEAAVRGDIELRVYPGANGLFTLYDDDGVSCDYEKDAYVTIPMEWDDRHHQLTIGQQQGSFSGMPSERRFHVVLVGPDGQRPVTTVIYTGRKVVVKAG